MSRHDSPPAAADSPVVAARDLRRTYYLGEPVHALDGVSLSLAPGSYTAVMGPSGSGKSTLLNLVGCLDTPDAGTIEIDGRDVGSLSGAERAHLRGTQIGFVFQTFNLMPRLTAAENVTLPMVFHDAVDEDRRERARTLLDRVGLGDRLDHLPSELSGGQRQRVAIARALANDPALLLADEPTGNLDTETGAEILELFDELHADGATILMVTHERHVAEHADRIVHVVDGEVASVEDVSDVDPWSEASGGAVGGPGASGIRSGPAAGEDAADDDAGERTGETRNAGDGTGDATDGEDADGTDERGSDDRNASEEDRR